MGVAFETFVSFSLGFEMCLLTHSLQEIFEGILYLYNLEMKRKYKKESVKKVKVYTTYTKWMSVFFLFFLIRFCKENVTVTAVSFGDVTIPKPGPWLQK